MPRGIEPRSPERQSGILAVGRRHLNSPSHFHTFALAVQHGGRDSNPQPPVLETGALPIETIAVCVSETFVSRGERSGPRRRAAPPPTGVACHVVGAGAGRPARPLRSRIVPREPMTRVVKHAGPRGPAGAAHAGRSVSPEAPGVPRRGARTRSAPPPTCGRRGAFLRQVGCGQPTPATDPLPRVVPDPARTTHCRRPSAYIPPNRFPRPVPPSRPPKAGAMVPPISNPRPDSPAAWPSARTPPPGPRAPAGAGAATDAVCGIRRAAAERVVVITASSFVRRPVARFVLLRYGRSPAADSVQTKTGGASDRPVSEAIPSRRPAPGAWCCADAAGRDSRLLTGRLSRSQPRVNPPPSNCCLRPSQESPEVFGAALLAQLRKSSRKLLGTHAEERRNCADPHRTGVAPGRRLG